MTAISDEDFGKRLCEVLGLDPKKTKDIIITCMVESPVMVYTTEYLQADAVEELLELLKKASPTFAERERITEKKPVPPAFPADREDWHGSQSPIG